MKYLLNKGMERDARQLALLIPRVRQENHYATSLPDQEQGIT